MGQAIKRARPTAADFMWCCLFGVIVGAEFGWLWLTLVIALPLMLFGAADWAYRWSRGRKRHHHLRRRRRRPKLETSPLERERLASLDRERLWHAVEYEWASALARERLWNATREARPM